LFGAIAPMLVALVIRRDWAWLVAYFCVLANGVYLAASWISGDPFLRIINAMGLERPDVYICNVVKCRPPGNRDPEVDEIAACSPFLLRQVQSIKPEVIVALGKVAAQMLLGSRDPISKIRGKFHDFHGIPLMPTYHPAFLKRKEAEGNKEAFWEVWDDMSQVLRLLKLPVPEKGRKKS
jgi:DNA polymerase